MPPCPLCKIKHPSVCGLRLFNSENECPICMEKNANMMALPCGHQFCKKDLERIGFFKTPPQIIRKPPRIVRRPRLPIIPPRRTTVRLPIAVPTRRRCGWCGHAGHQQRKCPAHRQQCGCRTYKTARHKQLHKTKSKCRACLKRGHRFRTCAHVIKGIK